MKHVYLVVEGPHDAEFVGKLLRRSGLGLVKLLSHLDVFWEGLVPRTFPYKNDLLRRVPVPLFYSGPDRSVAVHCAIGDANISNTVEETVEAIGPLDSIGVILDADSHSSPQERFEAIRARLLPLAPSCPEKPGIVSASGQPRCGVFVMPDNKASGTLEDLLLDCGRLNYPELHDMAQDYIAKAATAPGLDKSDLEEFNKTAGRNKAVVGAMASVLKPGKAIQVSVHDNRWLDDNSASLDRVQSVAQFLTSLTL